MNNERLVRLETMMTDTRDDVTEIKDDLKTLIATFDTKYYTRREGRVFTALLALAVSVTTLWELISNIRKG